MAAIPQDGRLGSQNVLSGPLTGGEIMYIVSPGNNAQGQSYQITTAVLATFFVAAFNPTVVLVGPAYNSVASDTRILLNLTNASALSIVILPSTNYTQPILVKDIKGNVDATHVATISFSSGQLGDGLATIPLSNPYAGIWLNPLPASVGGGFYLTQA